MARPDDPKKSQSYNNFAMDLLSPDDATAGPAGSSTPLSPKSPAAPPPSPSQPDQGSGISISKVPGGFQVSVVVGSMDEANEIAEKYFAKDSGDEDQGQGAPGEGDEGEGSAQGDSAMDTMTGGESEDGGEGS